VSSDNTPKTRTFETPILNHKHYTAPSVFTPESLLREARRQKRLPSAPVPAVCILDPDGDLVDYLRATECSRRHVAWACYHSQLDLFDHQGIEYGIVGRVVGAPYAVLVAEELFASGCQLIISITSAGQITPVGKPPYFVLIDRALRDEGTSYHYLPPSPFCVLRPELEELLRDTWGTGNVQMYIGTSWTTDAPFRETEEMILACRANGILAVEMEAAALYALAQAKQFAIVCFAHVTNQMAQQGDDFEKGPDQGSQAALQVISQTTRGWLQGQNAHRSGVPRTG
jgi:uridine phosphorylase